MCPVSVPVRRRSRWPSVRNESVTMKWRLWRVPVILAAMFAMPASAQLSGRPTRPQVTRPDGPVWQVIRKNCTLCHGIDDYAFFALDRAGWQALIEAKHKGGDVVLSNEDRNILLDW